MYPLQISRSHSAATAKLQNILPKAFMANVRFGAINGIFITQGIEK